MVMAVECPNCGCKHGPVRNTFEREITFKGVTKVITRRVRVCAHCKLPYTTVETLEDEDNIGHPAPEYFKPGKEVLKPKKKVMPQFNPYMGSDPE
jgi:hypothetical protein